jgi:type VI secretion system protein ImpE
MDAKEFFDAGNLTGAIEQLTQDVKTNPRDLRSRIFLFELLCFRGDFVRAERQLEAIGQTSGEVTVEMGVQVYRNAIAAERTRHDFFQSGNGQPKFLLEPPAYAALHLEAVGRLRENRMDEVENLLVEGDQGRLPVAGQLDGKSFEDLRDCDALVGPFLEIIIQKDYAWVPLEQIQRMEIQAPRTLRDLLWITAKVELRGRGLGEVLLPVNYYGSHEHPNDLVKLGRMTDWKPLGEDFVLGIGQRMFLFDDDERPLLELRHIEFAASS